MATGIVSRIETRAQREAGRRLARKARAIRQPKSTLPPAVQALADRMLSLRPGQADFWLDYLKAGGLDSWEGHIPTATIKPDAKTLASMGS